MAVCNWALTVSLRVPRLNYSMTYESSVGFQMETSIILRRGFCLQTMQISVISHFCFVKEDQEIDAHAELFFHS